MSTPAGSTPLVGPGLAAADEVVYLVGRPPMTETLGFLSQTIEARGTDVGALADKWRAANDHVVVLETEDAGAADVPAAGPLPAEAEQLAARVVADPAVRASFAVVPISIEMVELDRLVVFQKKINLTHVRSIQQRLPSEPTVHELFQVAMPLDSERVDPGLHGQLIGHDGAGNSLFAFASPSTDARVLETKIFDAAEAPGLAFTGAPVKLVVTAVGYGINHFSAIRIGTRLMLNNGSHRAYALRDAGITHVPCLIQNVTRRDELEVIGNGEIVGRYDAYFVHPRPPMLKDYFDERLRVVAHLPRVQRELRVTVQPQGLDAPASP